MRSRIGDLARFGGIAAAGIEPPAAQPVAGDFPQIDRERSALRVIDEHVAIAAGGRDVVRALQFVGDQRLIGHARQHRPRFHQLPHEAHLVGCRTMNGRLPVHQRSVHRLPSGHEELPDRMVPVRLSNRTGEQVPVNSLTNMRVEAVAVLFRAEGERMVFVQRFGVDHRLGRVERVVGGDLLPGLHGFRQAVPGLLHVHIEPGVVVEPRGGRGGAVRVVAHQHGTVILLAGNTDGDAFGHGAPDVLHAGGAAVAAENPDDALFPVAFAEELPVSLRVLHGENRLIVRARTRGFEDPTGPGWQQADVHTVAIRLVDHVVDVVPVVIGGGIRGVGARRDGGLCGILADQRQLPISVRLGQPVELGQRHDLRDGKALLRAQAKVRGGVLPVQAVKQFPGGIGEIKERLSVGTNEETVVIADPQRGKPRRRGRNCHTGKNRKKRQGSHTTFEATTNSTATTRSPKLKLP